MKNRRSSLVRILRRAAGLLLLSCAPLSAHEAAPPAAAAGVPKVLVYSDTGYYRHPDIPKINRWLVLLGHENGFEVDVTEHGKDLLPAALAPYDLLVLNNANELDKVLGEEERKSVQTWFDGGRKGIVGLHAALVHQTKWPWLNEPATGGRFFYTEFGHDLRSLSTPLVRRHILEGIRWAGRLPATAAD